MAHSEPAYLYLTTTGRHSKLPREIEIWFTEYTGRFYLISERSRSANWVRNIETHPDVQWHAGGKSFRGRARLVDPHTEPELCQTIQKLFVEKYGWGAGLVVELAPE